MGTAHERFERLVVGHVLDELGAPDAAMFRAHLMRCGDCRSRVAELRSIAADLAQIDATERERAAVRTVEQTDTTGAGSAMGGRGRPVTVRHVTVAAMAVLLLAIAMGLWNFHLRTTSATYLAAAEARGETLAGLATGTAVDAQWSGGVSGLVARDGDALSLVIADLRRLAHDEQLLAWWLDGDATVAPPVRLAGPTTTGGPSAADGETTSIAATLDDRGAPLLVVTRERGIPGDLPTGVPVLRVDLDDGPPPDADG